MPYSQAMIDRLRTAVEALNEGDAGPFAALFADDAERHERHHALTIRDGLVADMQLCGSWRDAKRFATRRAR